MTLKCICGLMVCLLIAPAFSTAATGPAPAEPITPASTTSVPAEDSGWRFLWDEGLRLTGPDNVTTFKFGGLFQWDFASTDEDGPALASHHDWRMVRPHFVGKFGKDIDWTAEFDFANPQVRMTDVFVRFSNVPWVKTVRVGHFKEPILLDQITSSANMTFPEPALPIALAPARSYGLMVGGPGYDDRMTCYVGVFRSSIERPSRATTGGDAWALDGRVTALPQYEEEGRHLIHLGASASVRFPDKPVRFSSKPESVLASTLTDTKNIAADDVELLGGEIGTVQGPFHMMAEVLAARVNREAGDDLWLDGFYVEAGWFLTGESRPYDRRSGIWGQVKPKKNVTDGGIGAWQVAARYSLVDLTGEGTPAGARKLRDVTVGVTWFLTQNLKVSVDWVNSNATPATRDGGMLQARVQASF